MREQYALNFPRFILKPPSLAFPVQEASRAEFLLMWMEQGLGACGQRAGESGIQCA